MFLLCILLRINVHLISVLPYYVPNTAQQHQSETREAIPHISKSSCMDIDAYPKVTANGDSPESRDSDLGRKVSRIAVLK